MAKKTPFPTFYDNFSSVAKRFQFYLTSFCLVYDQRVGHKVVLSSEELIMIGSISPNQELKASLALKTEDLNSELINGELRQVE